MKDLSKVKAFVTDVDGVLTDGGIYAVNGDMIRRFDAKDGMGLRMASMNGYILGVITGGESLTIPQRMDRCGITRKNIYLHSHNKVEELEKFRVSNGLEYDEILYCGDDLPDIPPMRLCGFSACPADAVPEVKETADYVALHGGGHGFMREVTEMVMKAAGKWKLDLDLYKKRF